MINYKMCRLSMLTLLSLFTAGFSEIQENEIMKETNNHPKVLIQTSMGDIKVELYEDKAPISVKNFLAYAADGSYDGTIFHRVIDGFMIQGGGFTKDFKQKPTKDPIQNEADNGLKNERGTLAMARTNVVNSATSQFFINVKDNSFLDFRGKSPSEYGYAVFGKVTEGMDIVDQMKKVKTGNFGPHGDVPTEAIEIQHVKVIK